LWDDHQWLSLLNRTGERQAQHHRKSRILGAAISEDGSLIAVVDAENHVAILGPDLHSIWEKKLSQKLHTVALDSFGEHIAVSEVTGRIRLLDRNGQLVRDFQCPRPAHHLAFEPMTTQLIAAADFGLVACLDLLSGDWIWRETPVVHQGSIVATGSGDLVLVACFTDGLRIYDQKGKVIPLETKIPACRAVAAAFDGRLIVTVGLQQSMYGYSPTGKQRFEHRGEQPFLAVAISGLGDRIYAASAEPKISAWSFGD